MTVLAVSKPNGAANAYSLLMSPGPFNDATKKELLPPDTIVASGNFKSSLVDQWSVYRPKKVHTFTILIVTIHVLHVIHIPFYVEV